MVAVWVVDEPECLEETMTIMEEVVEDINLLVDSSRSPSRRGKSWYLTLETGATTRDQAEMPEVQEEVMDISQLSGGGPIMPIILITTTMTTASCRWRPSPRSLPLTLAAMEAEEITGTHRRWEEGRSSSSSSSNNNNGK